jgi:hypothetical protein
MHHLKRFLAITSSATSIPFNLFVYFAKVSKELLIFTVQQRKTENEIVETSSLCRQKSHILEFLVSQSVRNVHDKQSSLL